MIQSKNGCRYCHLLIGELLLILSIIITTCSVKPKRELFNYLTIKVVSKDENNRPLDGCDISLVKGNKIKRIKTVQDGSVSVNKVFEPPFTIITYPPDSTYVIDTTQIGKEFSTSFNSMTISIKKKSTIIKGKIIESTRLWPLINVNINLEPGPGLSLSDSNGDFSLIIPDFKKNVKYTLEIYQDKKDTIKFYDISKDSTYSIKIDEQKFDLSNLLSEIKSYCINDLGTIKVETNVWTGPGIDTNGTIFQYPGKRQNPTLNQ